MFWRGSASGLPIACQLDDLGGVWWCPGRGARSQGGTAISSCSLVPECSSWAGRRGRSRVACLLAYASGVKNTHPSPKLISCLLACRTGASNGWGIFIERHALIYLCSLSTGPVSFLGRRVAFALPASAPLCRRRHSAGSCRLRPAAPRTHAAQVHCRSSLVDNCILVTVVWKLRLLVPRLFSPAVHWMRGKLQFAQLRER